MKINRHGSAQWQGGIKDGRGAISTESGALKAYPYGFASRFEGLPGTNPEELLAAAHAGSPPNGWKPPPGSLWSKLKADTPSQRST